MYKTHVTAFNSCSSIPSAVMRVVSCEECSRTLVSRLHTHQQPSTSVTAKINKHIIKNNCHNYLVNFKQLCLRDLR